MPANKGHAMEFGWIAVAVVGLVCGPLAASGGSDCRADDFPAEATVALRRAVDFFSQRVAAQGGYVYRYSADLSKREGEGQTGPDTVWVQPPGTPAVGMAYLEAHALVREPFLLDAALATGRCLVRGQLRSGGWRDSIELAPGARKKYAYRVEPAEGKRNDVTTFDDNKTQSAARFLAQLDQRLNFANTQIHEAARFALDAIVKAQRPNGGWPQGYQDFPRAEDFPVQPASFPATWSREFPGGAYWHHYTLNDNAVADTISLLFEAAKIYDEPRYRAAAVRGSEFLLLAQLPEPQPAWAQQYDRLLQPAWARKFEPPAITGGESQRVLQTLLDVYVETGDRKFLEPIPRAVAYLKRSLLSDGRLARFYELRTNRPLYLTRAYELTYDDSDLPTHYSFKIGSNLDSIERRFAEVSKKSADELARLRTRPSEPRPRPSQSLEAEARKLVAALDERGAWVEDGKLSYHGKSDDTRRIIASQTFARNLVRLARYVASVAHDE